MVLYTYFDELFKYERILEYSLDRLEQYRMQIEYGTRHSGLLFDYVESIVNVLLYLLLVSSTTC